MIRFRNRCGVNRRHYNGRMMITKGEGRRGEERLGNEHYSSGGRRPLIRGGQGEREGDRQWTILAMNFHLYSTLFKAEFRR